MSALVRLNDAHRNLGGFILFMTRCQRPTCRAPIIRIAINELDPALNTKWCSKTCHTWGIRSRKASPIVMVSGRCPYCRRWFTRVEHQANVQKMEGFSYCSPKCRATAKWLPCDVCNGKNLRRPDHAVCASCFYAVLVSCAGKDRFYEMRIAESRVAWYRRKQPAKFRGDPLTIYRCWVCNALHVGRGDVGENLPAAKAAAVLRQRLGPDGWDALVEQWSKQNRQQAKSASTFAVRRSRPAYRAPGQ